MPCDDAKNYNPVSSLCFITKLDEQVVASLMIDHINSKELDKMNQFTYEVSHLTETVLLSIKNETHHSLSKGEASALALLNCSAMFDTFDHSTLLSCLQT